MDARWAFVAAFDDLIALGQRDYLPSLPNTQMDNIYIVGRKLHLWALCTRHLRGMNTSRG